VAAVRRLFRRAGGRLRPPRRLVTTREGRAFILISIGLGFAAINTGNNLLYLLLGWMLSTIIASGALSDVVLRGLTVTRRTPPAVHAGRPFQMELEVGNTKRRLSSFALVVTDVERGRGTDKSVFFLKLAPGRAARASYRHTLYRRGLVPFEGVRLETRFPFGLFTKSRALDLPGEVLVFPALRQVTLPTPRGRRQGDAATSSLGRRGDFFALKEYKDGDDRRAIHWRTSAKAGQLLVRELEEESQRRVALFLDNTLDPARDERGAEELEQAISLAASLAVTYLAGGFVVRVIARGQVLGPFAGRGDEHPLLRALALLAGAAPGTAFAAEPQRGEDRVLVAPEGAAAADWPPEAEIALAQRIVA
jgi:uncharacterized protein (DUF58 family)